MIVVSIGCPCGVGPEVSVKAAAKMRGVACVLVGDRDTIADACEVAGVSSRRFRAFDPRRAERNGIYVHSVGPKLSKRDRRPGKPSKAAGEAQLVYIEEAYALVKSGTNRVLVTGPVNKEAVARSGAARARAFVGHTEYLRHLDGARAAVMCFYAPRLATSLVTTHLPLSGVPKALSPNGVRDAIVALAELLVALGQSRPRIAVASLNPHAGEGELFGVEERRAIVPGIERARRGKLRGTIVGPIGAETAYRLAYAGKYDGVVAMYHDQATIPMKLVAFGDAVNVTMGLSVVRTSVDHGTGYDIAWQGKADASGMRAAMDVAARLARAG